MGTGGLFRYRRGEALILCWDDTSAAEISALFCKEPNGIWHEPFRVSSRFIEEIPKEYLELQKADFFSRRKHYVDRPGLPGRHSEFESTLDEDYSQINHDDDEPAWSEDSDREMDGFRAGSRIVHPIFGEGVVRSLLGRDKVMVEFPGRGVKKISLRFTQLKNI